MATGEMPDTACRRDSSDGGRIMVAGSGLDPGSQPGHGWPRYRRSYALRDRRTLLYKRAMLDLDHRQPPGWGGSLYPEDVERLLDEVCSPALFGCSIRLRDYSRSSWCSARIIL